MSTALVKVPGEGLVLQHFPTPELAAEAAQERDLKKGNRIKSSELAKKLGVESRVLRRAYSRGDFPATEHGERLLMIDLSVARLISTYGLRTVASMHRQGLI